MLLGFDNLSHFPTEMDRKESLALWSSEQGTGLDDCRLGPAGLNI
jgi:hypothetical protein